MDQSGSGFREQTAQASYERREVKGVIGTSTVYQGKIREKLEKYRQQPLEKQGKRA
jgi:hypothetical protein